MLTTIAIEAPRQPEIEALLELSADYAQSLYPPESNFLLGVAELERPGVSFYAARDESGRVQGIGALVPLDGDTAELKRMFVHPGARGRGVAGLMPAPPGSGNSDWKPGRSTRPRSASTGGTGIGKLRSSASTSARNSVCASRRAWRRRIPVPEWSPDAAGTARVASLPG
jgi:GNAT superfamily N-acetyltransferase